MTRFRLLCSPMSVAVLSGVLLLISGWFSPLVSARTSASAGKRVWLPLVMQPALPGAPANSSLPTPKAQPRTATPTPTPKPKTPTATPKPKTATATPKPTSTSAPVNPTATPKPTSTSAPVNPTATPAPRILPTATAEPAPAASGQRFVATDGNDANSGTSDQPFRTITKGLRSVRAGETLVIRGGVYRERIQLSGLATGSSDAPVRVQAYPGERPVVQGLLWLKGLQHWQISGLNVSWDAATGQANEHMVKLSDGVSWSFRDAEVWGAKSYAAILISGAPRGFTLANLFVHDTYKTNSSNQDHLIYVNVANASSDGLIERCVLVNSANGRAIKIGPPSGSTSPIGGVTIRYNTMYNNQGPSNVQLSYGASNVTIYRNVMARSGSGNTNVTIYNLNGSGNRAWDNIGWESSGVIDSGSGLDDGGNNLRLDPQFANAEGGALADDYRVRNSAATSYGAFAP